MSKCGKSFLPECEYFTTGGCISPFNCPYRIEELSPNSATSVSSIYVQNLISENAVLKTENADLQKRLDNAVELPCVKMVKTKVRINSIGIVNVMPDWAVVYTDRQGDFVVEHCKSKIAAEARLEELKGDGE